ncbi:MAG: Glycosyltransferase [Berkelbacteria bacterium GW2011_GWA1_36_9]|uniref:Glycosyltransferase n=1 Tax=Berkelbacteria bacterium GW2011_GWA1_36_9 TaxID=1618331 RepID=A0A0G0FHE2_9BACT|nr:MAG: Glycosyltransferase [Berkelbacteria bacterium GW2011_GWA1_36_9]
MKIAINSLPLKSGHKYRGIGFYTKYLLDGLKKKNLDIQEFSDISEVKDADIVHYPFFDFFKKTLPIKKKFPTVVTIHDVTPLLFPKHYPPGVKGSIYNMFQRLALRDVRAIITDSKSSKGDIEKILNIKPSKIFPVYLAPAPHFRNIKNENLLDKVRNEYRLPQTFALYTGSVNWNKNILNLTKATLDSGIELVLAGKDFEEKSYLNHPERKSYAEFLNSFSADPKIHILGFIPDEDLVACMNLAKIILLPSYYEGFGLPILEAQACNIPVICGNVSSMPEVAGDGAVLINPSNCTEINQAIVKILNDKIFRNNLVKNGTLNVKRFSWEKCAEDTIKVYEYALQCR